LLLGVDRSADLLEVRVTNLSLGQKITTAHYSEVIHRLQLGLEQLRSMNRREAQNCCAVCGDNGHTAEGCWYFNPLHLTLVGIEALVGSLYKCFHCGAVYTDEESARHHFGKTPDSPAECLRQLAEYADPAYDVLRDSVV
jgi:hypothetical protein